MHALRYCRLFFQHVHLELIAHVIVYMLSLGLDRIYVVQQSHISINLDVRKHVSSTFIMVFVVLCGLLLLW